MNFQIRAAVAPAVKPLAEATRLKIDAAVQKRRPGMPFSQNRRDFLLTTSLAATAGVMSHRASFAAEPPPETTRIRLGKNLAICFAPLYLVEASLLAQGFTDVQYVESGLGVRTPEMVAQGDVDLAVTFAGTLVHEFDLGRPLIAVGGLHVGCYELFAREAIQSIRDLKGRRVSIHSLVSDVHIYISIMAANIGLDPTTDIEWVPNGSGALESFAAGETDAFLGFPPERQELRARGHRRVILNTVLDHPWSQYYCCLMFSNPTWVTEHPSATKRALRAMYQAAEFCTAQPEQAAQRLYDGGFVERYDYALETIQSIPYNRWHEYDAEDTLRFFALRMHEAGLLSNSPNTLLSEGTDWRFVNELKREMKS